MTLAATALKIFEDCRQVLIQEVMDIIGENDLILQNLPTSQPDVQSNENIAENGSLNDKNETFLDGNESNVEKLTSKLSMMSFFSASNVFESTNLSENLKNHDAKLNNHSKQLTWIEVDDEFKFKNSEIQKKVLKASGNLFIHFIKDEIGEVSKILIFIQNDCQAYRISTENIKYSKISILIRQLLENSKISVVTVQSQIMLSFNENHFTQARIFDMFRNLWLLDPYFNPKTHSIPEISQRYQIETSIDNLDCLLSAFEHEDEKSGIDEVNLIDLLINLHEAVCKNLTEKNLFNFYFEYESYLVHIFHRISKCGFSNFFSKYSNF